MRAMPSKPDFPTVTAYLAAQDPAVRTRLERLRAAIRCAAPDARETMQFRMPAYVLGNETILAMAAQKRYLSLYVMRPEILTAFAKDIAHLGAGKACQRLGPNDDISTATLSQLLDAAVAATRRGDSKAC